jgi:hypothetical protein
MGPARASGLRVGGFNVETLNHDRLRQHRDAHGESTEALVLRVRDDGSEGGVNLTVGYADARKTDDPVIWMSLSPEQARLVYAALGCALQMRDAQAVQPKPEKAPNRNGQRSA